MESKLLMHPKVAANAQNLINRKPHAVLITGPDGSGKVKMSEYLVLKILGGTYEQLSKNAYYLKIDPDADSISIDEIRAIQNFIKLRVPSKRSGIHRIITIINAERMRTEAQNALLKTLEEPPEDTMIILTSSQADRLLQTITSRTVELEILPVPEHLAKEFYHDKSVTPAEFSKAYSLSLGQPGLLAALLSNSDHNLIKYVELGKKIIGLPAKDRVLLVDELSKDKAGIKMLLQALLRIARAGLNTSSKTGRLEAIEKWLHIEKQVQNSIEFLPHNPNTKLLLVNLFISI